MDEEILMKPSDPEAVEVVLPADLVRKIEHHAEIESATISEVVVRAVTKELERSYSGPSRRRESSPSDG